MTSTERSTLEFYKGFREATPTLLDVARFNLPILAFWSVIVAACVWLAIAGPAPWMKFVAGLPVGAALRDLRRMHDTAKIWPWARGLIDWNEVDRRLAG